MNDEELLKRFNQWKARVGRETVLSFLTARKIGPSTADALERGDYNRRPRKKLRSVLLEIAEERAS